MGGGGWKEGIPCTARENSATKPLRKLYTVSTVSVPVQKLENFHVAGKKRKKEDFKELR